MITKIEQRLTWLMAFVSVLGLISMLKVDLFSLVYLQIGCRELIHGGNFMNAAAGITRSMIGFLPNGFFIITIFVAVSWITSRMVRITLWAISILLYALLSALGVAGTIASLDYHVSAKIIAMDSVITLGFVLITMISVYLFRRSLKPALPETPARVTS